MDANTVVAVAARTGAERQRELVGVLHRAAYAIFMRAAVEAGSSRQSGTVPVGPNVNFLLAALREAGDVVTAALGDDRARELRTIGKAMTMDEAIAYALSNIDQTRLT